MNILNFYKNRKILITGHTGFKGSWMCKLLTILGAEVTGVALQPPTNPCLFEISGVKNEINSVELDIRNLGELEKVFKEVQPEVVIHMAAQPLVRESYNNPVYTYETNVMGTVNVLECVRRISSVKSVVNVTTDKVYKNREWNWGYRENEELNGYDPYSNSKSCSELVTSSYINSFFGGDNHVRDNGEAIAISTCRAGNVIGGGDFAKDRIIPDCVRAAGKGEDIIVRNPFSTRPYQHVLEPVVAYLMIAAAQHENVNLSGCYNIGPDDVDCWNTGELVDLFCKEWKKQTDEDIQWINQYDGGPHEAGFLKLDCSLAKSVFGWKPIWNVHKAMQMIVEWEWAYRTKGVADAQKCMERQIHLFLKDAGWNDEAIDR